jgi:hypothetical protein
MLSSLISSTTEAEVTGISTGNAIFYACVAGVLGIFIALTYMKTGKVSKNFARTLIVLPILVCVVMLAVNGNLGASVAVLGAFSLVRFRSLQGTSREIAFIFFSMTIGITCSIGYLLFAVVITALVCGVHLVLQAVKFGDKQVEEKELRVTIPENLDYTEIFDDLFETFTKSHKLVRVKTTNMGSMYELTYHLQLTDEAKEKKFLDEIRCRNGNLTVICGRCDYNVLEEL